MAVVSLYLAALSMGCRPSEAEPQPVPATLSAQAHEAGYRVARGEFQFGANEGCCLAGADCQLVNPSSPYGTWLLPPGPDQVAEDVDPFEDVGLAVEGLSRAFRMREDEAIVFVGRTPPPSRYLSYRSYLALRRIDGVEAHVVGSLGPSLNHLSLAEQVGTTDVFDHPIAIVTTMDAAVEADVHQMLRDTGFPDEWIFDDRIPPEVVRPGLDEDDDSLLILTRVALPDDPAALDAYMADPGADVLRLSPLAPRAALRPHPKQPLPERGTGTTEAGLAGAVEALEDAVRAAWPDHLPIGVDTQATDQETYDCIDQAFCAGEITDRYWASSPNFTLPDDGSFAVVLGVNHRASGKATYANFAIDNLTNLMGVAGADDRAFDGSARVWLPDHPDADLLYAWTVDRSCDRHQGGCLELPTSCPGATFDDRIRVSVRAYLEPETGAAPLPEELVPDRVLKFYPRNVQPLR